jgi:hypothetical protein
LLLWCSVQVELWGGSIVEEMMTHEFDVGGRERGIFTAWESNFVCESGELL